MKLITAGNISDAVASALRELGFDAVPTLENTNVLSGLGYHPDMQLVRVGNTVVCDPGLYDYYSDIFAGTSFKLLCGKAQTQCNYPQDVAYNIKVAENNVFHNFKYTDEVLLELLDGMNKIDVSQGYSGCSICTAGHDAIITADTVIHAAALRHGIDSLLISPGHIQLPGFNYGFIGGASFYHDGGLYFFGNVKTHPDFAQIYDFCRNHGTRIYSLTTDELYDYGGAVTLD
ncbi:MAG: hypothetical protein J6D26_07645 [Clostridia bacterium]|nr:hypothetical protein [Clostridia bacterium]